MPLLSKYAEDGIIKKEFIPHENYTDTEYVIGPIVEKQIEFTKNPKFKADESDFLYNEEKCFDIKKSNSASASYWYKI